MGPDRLQSVTSRIEPPGNGLSRIRIAAGNVVRTRVIAGCKTGAIKAGINAKWDAAVRAHNPADLPAFHNPVAVERQRPQAVHPQDMVDVIAARPAIDQLPTPNAPLSMHFE